MKKFKKVLELSSLLLCGAFCLSACGVSEWFGDNLGGGGDYSGGLKGSLSSTNTAAIGSVVNSITYDTDTSTTSYADATELTAEYLSGILEESSGAHDYKIAKDATESTFYITASTFSSLSYGFKIQKSCTIYLDGANFTFSPAEADAGDLFRVTKDVNLTIVAVNGTQNSITLSGYAERAINLRGDDSSDITLSIIGSGSLSITSPEDCIKSKGNLIIKDATLSLTSTSGNAIQGNSVVLNGCTIEAYTSSSDAIKAEIAKLDEVSTAPTYSSTDDFYAEGYVCCIDANLTIVTSSTGDGIQADTFAYFNGGTYSIKTNGGAPTNITDSSSDSAKGKAIKVSLDYTLDTDKNTSIDLECEFYALYIVGGTFSINSNSDALHSDADLYIAGGTFTISTGDDGMHANSLLQIVGENTSITISKAYEGIEAAYLEIGNGTISVYSSDDGVNAAGETDCYIMINGGTLTVNALGDGLDSNGSIFINGGSIYVNGPSSDNNNALDSDDGILVTGGELFTVGPKEMVETPTTNSTQCVISYSSNSSISAGSTLTLKDSGGNSIISLTTARSCQSIIISSGSLVQGATYSLYSGTTKLSTFTLSTSSIITEIGSQGTVTSPEDRNNNGGSMGGMH